MSHLIVVTSSNRDTQGQRGTYEDVSIPMRMDERQSGNLDFIFGMNSAQGQCCCSKRNKINLKKFKNIKSIFFSAAFTPETTNKIINTGGDAPVMFMVRNACDLYRLNMANCSKSSTLWAAVYLNPRLDPRSLRQVLTWKIIIITKKLKIKFWSVMNWFTTGQIFYKSKALVSALRLQGAYFQAVTQKPMWPPPDAVGATAAVSVQI